MKYNSKFFALVIIFCINSIGEDFRNVDENCSKFHIAVQKNDSAAFHKFPKDMNVNCQDTLGNTIMHVYAKHSANLVFLTALVKRGVRLGAKNKDGETPLMLAVRGKRDFVIDWFFACERHHNLMNIDAQNSHNQTALHIAVTVSDPIAVSTLLRNGANLTIKDRDNNTAFELAKQLNHSKIVDIFQKHFRQQTVR